MLQERTELQTHFLQRETKILGMCENKGITQGDNQYQRAGRRQKGVLITDLHMSCLYLGYSFHTELREPSAPLPCHSTQTPSEEQVLRMVKPLETPAISSLAFVKGLFFSLFIFFLDSIGNQIYCPSRRVK